MMKDCDFVEMVVRVAVGAFLGLVGFMLYTARFDTEPSRWSPATVAAAYILPTVSGAIAAIFGGATIGPRSGGWLKAMAWWASAGALVGSALGAILAGGTAGATLGGLLGAPSLAMAGVFARWVGGEVVADRAGADAKPAPPRGSANPTGVGDRDLDGA